MSGHIDNNNRQQGLQRSNRQRHLHGVSPPRSSNFYVVYAKQKLEQGSQVANGAINGGKLITMKQFQEARVRKGVNSGIFFPGITGKARCLRNDDGETAVDDSTTEVRKEKPKQSKKRKQKSNSERRSAPNQGPVDQTQKLKSLIEHSRQKMTQVKLDNALSSRLVNEFNRIEKKLATSEFYVTESERDLLTWAHDLLIRIESVEQKTTVARAG